MSDNYAISTVEYALDAYIEKRKGKGIEPTGVTAAQLAKYAQTETWEMSGLLQEYRNVNPSRRRYGLAAEGYGRAARWRILSRPGSDPVAVQEARVKHAQWIAVDAARRVVRDLDRELRPNLRGTTWDNLIEIEGDAMEHAVRGMVRRAAKAVEKTGVEQTSVTV